MCTAVSSSLVVASASISNSSFRGPINKPRWAPACSMAARMSELVDELLQRNLARDSLRHLDHGREVEVFDGRRKRTRQTGGWLIRSELRIQFIELPHL